MSVDGAGWRLEEILNFLRRFIDAELYKMFEIHEIFEQ